MKKLLSFLGVSITVVAGLLHSGCGARVEVAKEKLLKKIDSLLGETEIRRKDIQLTMEAAERAVDELAQGRITAKVRSERLASEIQEIEKKVGEADSSLAILRNFLTSEKPIEIAGKTYPKEKVKEMADRVIQIRKTLNGQVEALKRAQATLDRAVGTLEVRENGAKEKISALKSQVQEIDAQFLSLNTLRDAAQVAGDSNKTFAENLDALEKQVATLHDKVKTDVLWEEEKWKVLDAKKELETVENIISATKGTASTVEEIDRILGKSR